MKSQDILPVLFSVVIIIVVAIVEKQSKLFAAITATMPLTAALGLWIVYSSAEGEQTAVTDFAQGMIIGILPTFAFLIAVWLAARAGFKLGALLGLGYLTWALALLALLAARRFLGVS